MDNNDEQDALKIIHDKLKGINEVIRDLGVFIGYDKCFYRENIKK